MDTIEILGWIVCVCISIAPIAFPDPVTFAKTYFTILIIMSVILEIVRISLAHFLPDQEWVMRPENSPCKGFIPGMSFAYNGGFVSGHIAATAFASTLLFIAYPNIWSLLVGIGASVIIFLFRYYGRCHTKLQLVCGWIVGFLVALYSQRFFTKKLI